MSNKGLLIVIDGLDGSGKNTQTNILYNFFRKNGVNKIIKLSFPDYDSYTGKIIREMLTGKIELDSGLNNYNTQILKALLFSYDRMITMNKKIPEYDNKTIKELYDDGYVILCDRYTTSNFFHMTTDLSESETISFINEIEEIEYQKMNIIKPDIVIALILDPEISMKLINKRGNEKDDNENLDHLKKAYNKLQFVLDMKPEWKMINCNNDEKDYIKGESFIQDDIKSVLRDCVAKEFIDEIINKIDKLDMTKDEDINFCLKCNHKLIQLIFEPGKYYCPNCESIWITK